VRDVESQQRSKHPCPQCGHKAVGRVGTGIWKCRKCKYTFAGGAYVPRTESAQNVDRILKGEVPVSESK
jgi:large subunit ribosomal protein L37Ae